MIERLHLPAKNRNHVVAAPEDLDALSHEQLLDTTRHLLALNDRMAQRWTAMHDLASALGSSLDQATILENLRMKLGRIVRHQHLSLCLRAPEGGWLHVTLRGETPGTRPLLLPQDCALLDMLEHPHARVLRNAAARGALPGYASQVLLPLETDTGLLVGTLNLGHTAPGMYTMTDIRESHTLSRWIANALYNAERYEQLQQRLDQMRGTIDDLEAYNYSVAHDLKAPLAAIIGFTDLAQHSSDRAESAHCLNGISQSAARMQQMIDELLQLAHLKDNHTAVTQVEVSRLVDSALITYAEKIMAHNIAVEILLPLPPVLGHAPWIEQVFANLIGNAIKYLDAGKQQAVLTICAQPLPDAMVRYEVQDNGIGIAPQEQGRIFDLFSRAQPPGVEGSGIGLAIVQRIVRRLGGEVGVESTPGAGSIFWFTLPSAVETDLNAPLRIPLQR